MAYGPDTMSAFITVLLPETEGTIFSEESQGTPHCGISLLDTLG